MFVVEAQTGIKNDGAPLMFQLQIGIGIILVSLANLGNVDGLGQSLGEITDQNVTGIVQLKVVVLSSEGQQSLVRPIIDIAPVALYLETDGMLLSAD